MSVCVFLQHSIISIQNLSITIFNAVQDALLSAVCAALIYEIHFACSSWHIFIFRIMGSFLCATLMYANLCFSKSTLKKSRQIDNISSSLKPCVFFCSQAPTWFRAKLPPVVCWRAISMCPALGSSLYPSGIRDNLRSSIPLDERQPESLISSLTVTSVVDAEQKLEWECHTQRLSDAWAGGKSTQCSWIQIGQVHLHKWSIS